MTEKKRELSDAGKHYQETVRQRYESGIGAQHGGGARPATDATAKPGGRRIGILVFAVIVLIVVAFVSGFFNGGSSSPEKAAADTTAKANTAVASAGTSKYSSTYESSAYGSSSTSGSSSKYGSTSKYGSSSYGSSSSKSTSSGNDFRIMESGYDDANGKGYKGSDGNYYFKNHDGSVEATDGFGNGVKDINGDGKADYYTTDSGETWKKM